MLTENMVTLIELEEEKARLEQEIKEVKRQVLEEMTQSGMNDVDHNGTHIRLVETSRNTVRDKLALVNFIKANPALRSCLTIEPKADMDMLKLAVQVGTLSQDDFNSLVRVTTTKTLKVGK